MGKFCTQCGKETGGGRFCIYCGAPIADTPPPVPPDREYGAAMEIPGQSGETLPLAYPGQGDSAQPLPPKPEETEREPQHLPPVYGHGPQPGKKSGGWVALAIAIGGIAVVALIVFSVLLLARAGNPPVGVTDAYVTTGTVDSQQLTPMMVLAPDDRTITLYGEADNLKDDTIVEIQWYDETDGGADIGRTTATVDAEQGIFYSRYDMPAGSTFQLVYSGDYLAQVFVDGGEEPVYTVPFSVYSDIVSTSASYPINDAYMVSVQGDGSCAPVAGYPEGTEDLVLMLSFAQMDQGAAWMMHWYRMEDGTWVEVGGDTEFTQITDQAGPGLYFSGLTADTDTGWAPGDYRVEAYLDDSSQTPSATVDFSVGGESASDTAAAQDVYVSDFVLSTGIDEDGYPVDRVMSYPQGTEAFYASFYVGGVTDPVEFSWEWYDESQLISGPNYGTADEDMYYWVQYGEEGDGRPFEAGAYRLVLYIEGEEIAETTFTVGGVSVSLEEGSIPLTEETWADWNDWLMTFTEGRLVPYEQAFPSDQDLINFAVQYNYFYNEDMYATLDEYGMCWLEPSALEYTLWWFFDKDEVTHTSTEIALYEGDSYGYKSPEEELPYMFPQVRGIYKDEHNVYTVDLSVYTAPVGFEDFNGTMESWEGEDIVPEYVGDVRARVRFVTERETTRRILLSYEEE